MDKCSLCSKINIYYKSKAVNLINSKTNDLDHMQILADRLLKFEGYETTVNKNLPLWICEECRKSLENFAKLLNVIKKGREKQQDGEQEYQEQDNLMEENKLNEFKNMDRHTEITTNIMPIGTDTTKTSTDPHIKRIRRPPKRFLDDNVYFPSNPIKIQIKQPNNNLDSSLALLPTIAKIRSSSGHLLGKLMEADNSDVSSRLRIKCIICSKVFCFEKEFREHLENHTKNTINNLEFTTFDNLSYYCEICQKSFQEHFAVRRHYKHAHSQERPFQCVHCTARFKYKFNLDYHMSKHLNKRDFQCPLCSKTFILRYELLIHQRIHAKEKPFKCQFCSISFAHRSNLVTHRRLHTQKKTLKCAMCQATFISLVLLKKHEKNHLLKTNPNFLKSDTEVENNENLNMQNTNISLPNFATLKSTLNSAKLNNNLISSTHNETTNDFDFLVENSLSSNRLQILKLPETNNHYNNIMFSKSDMLKTQNESGSFQIGNTTLKLIPKSPKVNECSTNKQHKMPELIISSTDNHNLNISYANSNILSNSPKSPMPDMIEYTHYKQQNMEIATSFITQNENFDISSKNFQVFENSPESTLMKIEKNVHFSQQKSHRFDNSTINNANLSFIQSKAINFQNSTICTNLENRQESFVFSIKNTADTLHSNKGDTEALNFLNFKNSTNSPKESPLMKSPKNQVKLNLTNNPNANLNYNTFAYTIVEDGGNSTKSPNILNQKSVHNFMENEASYNFTNSSFIRNSPKKSPLLKTTLNEEKLDITKQNNSFANFSNINMLNFKNSTKSTNILNAENFDVSSYKENPNVCNNFVNLPNSPKKNSLLKINFHNENHENHPYSKICLPKINLKSIKIVKISGDNLKTKLSNNNSLNGNLNTYLHGNPSPSKLTDDLRVSSENSQPPKLNYFTNNNKILEIIPSSSYYKEEFSSDPVKKNAYANEPISSLQSPSIPNDEILNGNLITQSGELSKINSELQSPLSLVTASNLKEIKIQKTTDILKNISSKTEESLKFKICKISQPIKLVKISSINAKANAKSISLENSTQMKENSTNSNENHQDLLNNMATNIKGSIGYNLIRSNNKLESNSKPAKIINIKHLKNLPTDFSSSKKIPLSIITKSKDIENKKNFNSIVTLRKTPVKLKLSPQINSPKPVSNATATSLLKSKINLNTTAFSKTPLITNIEILAPLKPLQTDNTPAATPSKSLLNKQINEYKFQCHNCWKYFKQKSALQKHLRTHTGEKPYKCNLCPKSYADASNYKKHKILHKNAAEALNINMPPQVSPHLPGHLLKQHSPTHSIASDPDPDGIEIMKTIKKFGSSSSITDEEDDDDNDIKSLNSESMESYMWQQALDHAITNDEIRENIIRNLSGINNCIMPPDLQPLLNDRLNKSFNCKDPD